ncbi:MAG: class I SAM-dependent methyltransferase, partial [Candidatus Nanoarchaeia archaeon]
ILDIGSRGNMFNKKYKTTTLDVVEDADVKQDLNKNQKLPFKDNSFDIVIMNQILEHLVNCDELIKEAKRVSKKYIFVGLPNEMTYGIRIKFLFGLRNWEGYKPYGHKHFFTIRSINSFIKHFFPDLKTIKSDEAGIFTGAGLLPYFIRDILAKLKPPLFAGEIYYLMKNEKTKIKKQFKNRKNLSL